MSDFACKIFWTAAVYLGKTPHAYGNQKNRTDWHAETTLLFEVAMNRILAHYLCLNVLKRRNRDDAEGETAIDRAWNTNGRLRPEHRILETVAGA